MANSSMDERVAFERWLLKEQGLDDEWDERRNCYKRFPAHLAWKAWQAGEARGFALGSGNEGAYQRRIRKLLAHIERIQVSASDDAR